MLSTKLITRDEIREYKQISKTANDDRLNDIIIQVQINEIRPLLGERLFDDILTNPSNYDDLLNGSTYDSKGVTYQNYGLKAVLAYYIDAYWKMFGDVTSTPYGNVTKVNLSSHSIGDSKDITDSFKKSLFTINKQSAYNIWLNVHSFLLRTEVPLYKFWQTKINNNLKINRIG